MKLKLIVITAASLALSSCFPPGTIAVWDENGTINISLPPKDVTIPLNNSK